MSTEFLDDSFRLYRYVRQLDRHIARIRRVAASRQPVVGIKSLLMIFLVIIPALAGASFLIQRIHTQYVLLTGPPGSSTAHIAPRLQAILNDPSPIERWLHLNIVPDFELKPSCGALDSIAQINAGMAQLGFAEDGLPYDLTGSSHCPLSPENELATNQAEGMDSRMRVVTLLYKSPLHIVARSTLGLKDLQDLSPGTKVYLGPDGSATNFVGQLIVEHYGLRIERQGHTLDFNQAAKALNEGQFDVAFFLMGLETDVLKNLLQTNNKFQLLSAKQTASLKVLFPYLEPLTIPAGIYPNTPDEIQTVSTNTVLVASTALRDAEIYETTKKVAEHAQNLLRDIPLSFAQEIDTDPKKTLFYQIHDGARLFFTHDPPFFLDLRTLASAGTYFSLVSAFFVMFIQFLRRYRVHRLLIIVDLILERSQKLGNARDETRPLPHLQKIRRVTLRLMRRRKITYDEYSRIEDYIQAYRL